MFIQDLIASAGDRLTPTERRIAEAVLADPALLAFGTVSDLAERAGTSHPSIVRFSAKLGFDGYRDLQRRVREDLSSQLSRPSQRIRRQDGSPSAVRTSIQQAVGGTIDALDPDRLAALAVPVVAAANVWILTGETSRAGAHVLRSGLSMIRPDVVLVEEHDVGRDLSGAAPGDVAIVLDFARYRRSSIIAARALAERGVDLVAITDGPLSPLAALTETWAGLSIPAIGPFDSSLPAVLAAELLVAEVARRLGDRALDRIDRLETLWEATGTFLEYVPRGSGTAADGDA